MEKITDKIAALPHDANYFSLEFFPPKTQMGFSNLQQRLDRMSRALRPLFVNVTWGAGGSTATKSLELAEICQRQLGLTTCLHLTCTNMSRLLVDEALEQAKVLGIRNILALRGDPPRSDEYREEGANPEDDSNNDFTWAVDLVRYIRKQHGDYFCIGVAAYPEGHFDQANQPTQSTDFDLPFLIEKTKAGADFLMTQLFYDVKKYNEYEDRLRNDPSGLFKAIPIIPGLMPIQSYSILRRVTKLSHATLPHDLLARLDAVKSDDEAVKSVGVDIMSEIVESIKGASRTGPRGFHFYTLNLEKAVAQVLQQCQLIPEDEEAETNGIQNGHANGANGANGAEDVAVVETAGTLTPPNGAVKDRRRISSSNSAPRNRVVVDSSRASAHSDREVPDDEAGIPKEKINSRATTLAISEGEGALGREATWDDFPNGRWGDARSPAFGEIDGYGVSLHVSINQAIQLWSHPVTVSDISEIFRRYLNGQVEAVPWSEEALNAETATIRNELLRLNAKGWWTVASQPAINGFHSSDPTHGWGPKNGFVFQKPFVELFLPSRDWEKLKRTLQDTEEVTFFASNGKGEFESSDADSVNPVTWGTFSGKEIVTPTIIEAVSFRAWAEEAFGIWKEWQRIYPPRSPTSVLLENIRKDYWLVNVIHHDFQKTAALWDLLADG